MGLLCLLQKLPVNRICYTGEIFYSLEKNDNSYTRCPKQLSVATSKLTVISFFLCLAVFNLLEQYLQFF